jgi:hypothetical protein
MDIGDTSPEGQPSTSNCAGAEPIAYNARSDLTKKIRVCIEKAEREATKRDHAAKKAEEFYIAAGQYINEMEDRWPDEWLEIVEQDCGLKRSRIYEIRAIGDGRTSVEKVRSDNAQRQRISRERRKTESVTVTDGPTKATEIDVEDRKAENAERFDEEEKEAADGPTVGEVFGSTEACDSAGYGYVALFAAARNIEGRDACAVAKFARFSEEHELPQFRAALDRVLEFAEAVKAALDGSSPPPLPDGPDGDAADAEPDPAEQPITPIPPATATGTDDLAIPPFLLRTPTLVDAGAIDLDVPEPAVPPVIPDPIPAPSPPSPPRPTPTFHQDMFKGWTKLSGAELEKTVELIRTAAGRGYHFTDAQWKTVDKMRERVLTLQKVERAVARADASTKVSKADPAERLPTSAEARP